MFAYKGVTIRTTTRTSKAGYKAAKRFKSSIRYNNNNINLILNEMKLLKTEISLTHQKAIYALLYDYWTEPIKHPVLKEYTIDMRSEFLILIKTPELCVGTFDILIQRLNNISLDSLSRIKELNESPQYTPEWYKEYQNEYTVYAFTSNLTDVITEFIIMYKEIFAL